MNIKMKYDKNGNKVLKLTFDNERGFSIQTNGNLPETHRRGFDNFNRTVTIAEINAYVSLYGSLREKKLMRWA